MRATSTICVGLFVVLGACTDTEGTDQPDAAPAIEYETFTPTTWSLANTGGQYQLSVTDGTGTAACALSSNHQNALGAAGAQLILQLSDASGVPCPVGMYPMRMNCPASLGAGAAVPESCAYYRRWDAQGALLGLMVALNGEITVTGTASSCSIRANVGFRGGSFAHTVTLTDGQAAQPWCN